MSVMIDFLYIKGVLLLVLRANLYNTQNHFSGVLLFEKVNLNVSFVTLYGIEDLGTCQQNCVDRQKCVALNYHTQFPYECVLNSEEADLEDRFGWVYQAKSKILMETPCDNCNYHQTCDRSALKCVYRECEPILSNEEYIRLGNGNTIGSRAVFACPNGDYPVSLYQPNTWPITAVCQDNGQWSFPWRPKCAEFDESFCQRYSVEPDTSEVYKSNFIKKTVRLVSGPCGVDDSDIISSTNYNSGFFAYMAKFDYEGDTWVSGRGDENPFIQVNFNRITEVKGIMIKGRSAPFSLEYPTLINVTYSTDCSQDMLESVVRNKTGGAEFTGNADGTSIVEHMFKPPIDALCVRVNILDYTNTIDEKYFGMKFDLFGTVKLPIL